MMRKELGSDQLDQEVEFDDANVHNMLSLGNGLELMSRRVVNFTPKKAEELLGMNEYEVERNFRPLHYRFLVKQMKQGTFRPEIVTIAVCELDGELYRMNGRHTSMARMKLPDEYPCKVNWLVYRAETKADMKMLYNSYDRGAPRTRENVTSSYLFGSDEFEGIGRDVLKWIPTGFAFWMWPDGNNRKAQSADDVSFLLLRDYHQIASKVARFLSTISKKENAHIFRAPVVAALFATFEKAPRKAEAFWTGVATGVGFAKDKVPGLRLRNFLQNNALAAGGGAHSSTVTREKMLRICITAWNAHVEDKEITNLRASEKGDRPTVKR